MEQWLSAQDQAEGQLLSSEGVDPALAGLRSQVDSAFDQVRCVTRSIQQSSAENDSLRREIASLRDRLTSRP